MTKFVLVETDNFGGDYPDEKFLSTTDSKGKSVPLLFTNIEKAHYLATTLNGPNAEQRNRWWCVKPRGYVLSPGFEP